MQKGRVEGHDARGVRRAEPTRGRQEIVQCRHSSEGSAGFEAREMVRFPARELRQGGLPRLHGLDSEPRIRG